MKILAITDLSGYMVGGPTTAAVHLLNGLVAKGHSVTLANDQPYPGLTGVEHERLMVAEQDTVAMKVSSLIARGRPDVVHLLSMGQRTLRLVKPALASAKWVLTVHSVPPYERILNRAHGANRLHYFLRNLKYAPHALGWRLMLRGLDVPGIIVHSPFVRKVLTTYGAHASRIHVIDLAVEEEGRSITEPETDGRRRIVTVAGIAHTKGLHDAVHAVARLRRDFPTLHYRIVGEVRDVKYLEHLKRLVNVLGLEHHVQINERVSADEKAQMLACAEIYLQPSHEEGFCLAYLEAALKVPKLVGTDTGAIRNISEGDAQSRVIAANDVDALVHSLDDLLKLGASSPTELEVRRARLLERFSWSKHVERHEDIYRLLAW